MHRTVQVVLVIAIVCSAVTLGALAVEYFEPIARETNEYTENAIARAELRWQVYWFSGLPIAIIGFFLMRRRELAGYALLISGVYLMLLGNNGGLWAMGFIGPRAITSAVTLIGLVALVWNQQWGSAPNDSLERSRGAAD